jgi:two-component system chemotaxis response regulator CheV
MMMDVEKVLSETTSIDSEAMFRGVIPLDRPDVTVFYCDDSSVARKQIERTLAFMGVKSVSAVNGRQMWEEMEKIASYAQSIGQPASSVISLVLTDIEMPEMDGYILTKKIKSDPRFNGMCQSSCTHRYLECRTRS